MRIITIIIIVFYFTTRNIYFKLRKQRGGEKRQKKAAVAQPLCVAAAAAAFSASAFPVCRWAVPAVAPGTGTRLCLIVSFFICIYIRFQGRKFLHFI